MLVVDDQRHFRLIERAILRGFGVRKIYEAGDAISALEVMRGQDLDVALIDLEMPTIDGVELINLIRGDHSLTNREIPIIVISAHARKSRVEESIAAGASSFLVKPVSVSTIFQRITNVVDIDRAAGRGEQAG